MIITIHTDGGSRGNPGPAAIGVVVSAEGNVLHQISRTIGIETNNVAEYEAIVAALTYLSHSPSLAPERVEFFLDSLLVTQQLNGHYAIKHPRMKTLYLDAKKIQNTLPYPVTYTHVRREQNTEADLLVNQALDREFSDVKNVN